MSIAVPRHGLALLASFLVASLVNAAEEPTFLKGGDISTLPRFEELGAVYRNQGKRGDLIAIMAAHGCTSFRVRLFVQPTMRNAVIQDIAYFTELGKRIKQAGALFLLDLHFSDTWADSAHQAKPAAWEDLDFAGLEAKVESYTAGVITACKQAGCLPDIVQVGNEVLPGFLWPEGQIEAGDGGWERFTALLKAGIRGLRQPLQAGDRVRVMLHIHPGGGCREDGLVLQADRGTPRGLRHDRHELLSLVAWHHQGLAGQPAGHRGDVR
jgi:arabinogalactan endo-1,4-beta-galactosidase